MKDFIESRGRSTHHHIGRIVVEDCGDVLPGEGVGGVADEKAGLPHRAVPYHHTFDGLHLTKVKIEVS